ncbi:MFS transporter [Methylomonas paludis]|uniref:MFS transporter n=1 Tax=Methylomonas paludis TaxID=1173101 RepID=A0A975MR03_9GAMM|nr:MFS transporter [Methylomonas paludis]QWF72402.1 MFS transporter [Methylomonas paludis]
MQISGHSNGNFYKLLSFRILIVLAYQIIATVVGWHIYELTHDTLALGLIGLTEAIAYFCSALFAGYAIDHYSRRLFGVVACLLLFGNALTLAAISAGWLGDNILWWIYGSIGLTGLARAFFGPTFSAMFALVVARDRYARAAGFATSVFQFGLVVGPALGGILVAWAGKISAYGVAAGLCLGSATALLSIRVKIPKSEISESIATSIGQGFRFVFSNQIILGAQSLDMFAVLFGGAVSLLPAFIHDVYHYGPEGLGILRAAPAIGAVMTGLYMARNPIHRHTGKWLLAAVAGFGISMICFALSVNFWLAGLLLILSGVFDGVSVVLRSTILQLATPDAMRGRVSAISGIFIGSSNELGAFESGIAARLMGLVPSVIFGGTMTLIVVGATAKLAPKLRRLELGQLQ